MDNIHDEPSKLIKHIINEKNFGSSSVLSRDLLEKLINKRQNVSVVFEKIDL